MEPTGLDALRRVPLFSACDDRQLESLADVMEELTAGPGEVLTQQGVPSSRFFIVLDGVLNVEVDGSPRPALRRGDFFGEISVIDRGPATATITVGEPAKLLTMSHAVFMEHVKEDERLLTQVLTSMGARLRADRE
jgi:protein phosphatase